MAIAKLPTRKSEGKPDDRAAEAFIARAGEGPDKKVDRAKIPTMIRVDPQLRQRFERAAKRLGISLTAFLVSAAAEKLERMDG